MSNWLLLIAGLIVLIKGADFLVSGACALAKRLNVSDLLIGLTVVAFGTSAPELFVNITAGIKGSGSLSLGNIIGSNIANVLLILGVSAIVFPLAVTRGVIKREIPVSFMAVLVMTVMMNDSILNRNEPALVSRADGLILVFIFIIFMYYTVITARVNESQNDIDGFRKETLSRSIILIVLGLLGLMLGSKWLVEGATEIARMFSVSESLIGLTIVAIGTSLPELSTSVMAAVKRKPDIAVGNVVGSNIFNILLILGCTALIRPIALEADYNPDMIVMIAAHLMLFLFMFTGQRKMIDRWEGIIFVIAYGSYISYAVIRG